MTEPRYMAHTTPINMPNISESASAGKVRDSVTGILVARISRIS